MSVPVSQMWAVASYMVRQRLAGRERFPLVLMLEPLYRCNLACAGCGKIQYPSHVLKRQLSVDEALAAADAVETPVVSLPGGEPLLHPEIEHIVEGLVERGRYVYLCTNAILLAEHLDRLTPSKHLNLSVHLDGDQEIHDDAVCREGIFDKATEAIREAVARGFRVTTNTTVYRGSDAARMRAFFDTAMELGVESMTLSPGYAYAEAPDQEGFLARDEIRGLFRQLLAKPKKHWRFNHSPLYLEFLTGKRHLECTPWANPSYGVFGWQRPCYLLQEGYARTFDELIEETDWSAYGHASGNPACADCMVHSGHEGTAVRETFASIGGLVETVRSMLASSAVPDPDRIVPFPEPERAPAGPREWERHGVELGPALKHALETRTDVQVTTHDGEASVGYLFDVGEDAISLLRPGTKEVSRVPIRELQRVEPAPSRSRAGAQ